MKTSTVLKRALRLLDGGRRWIKGDGIGRNPGVCGVCYCVVGAIDKSSNGALMPACIMFDKAIGTNETALWNDAPHRRTARWNDAPHRRWSHVEAAFKRAIKLAEKEERR